MYFLIKYWVECSNVTLVCPIDQEDIKGDNKTQ